jgi:hypothetical protein
MSKRAMQETTFLILTALAQGPPPAATWRPNRAVPSAAAYRVR